MGADTGGHRACRRLLMPIPTTQAGCYMPILSPGPRSLGDGIVWGRRLRERVLGGSGIAFLLLAVISCADRPTKPAASDQTQAIEASEFTPPPGDPLLKNRVSKGFSREGRLWLLGGRGALVSFGLPSGPRQAHFTEGVIDIAASNEGFWALRSTVLRPSTDGLWPAGGTFVLSSWEDGAFQDSAPFDLPEMPLALTASATAPMVLTSHALLREAADRLWRPQPLHGEIRAHPAGGAPIVLVAGRLLYIGHNFGEWGGGLQSLDPATGIVTDIERRDGRDLCDGPLNGDCDPVTGLAPATDEPGCIVVSIGLNHMMAHGRILKVCGSQVSVLFEKTWTEDGNGRPIEMSEPFYGLAAAKTRGFWAVSPGTLYRFEGKTPTSSSLPNPTSLGGIWVNRDQPGLLILYTDANWAKSLSGITPLLIPVE